MLDRFIANEARTELLTRHAQEHQEIMYELRLKMAPTDDRIFKTAWELLSEMGTRKIQCIKILRCAFNLGLKQAKDLYEAVELARQYHAGQTIARNTLSPEVLALYDEVKVWKDIPENR